MSDPTELTGTTSDPDAQRRAEQGTVPWWGLVICWSRASPERVGEIGFVPPRRELVLGRVGDDDVPRVVFGRHRPSGFATAGAPTSARLSRHQLRLVAREASLRIERLGRRDLRVDGLALDEADVGEGSVVEIVGEMVLLVVRRSLHMPLAPAEVDEGFDFGGPDAHGIVGESPLIWRLRSEIRFIGPRGGHALLLGPTGSGKELVARALHETSGRRGRPWVARNASTLPPSLIEAELFGHARGYPQAGMPARPGLVGEADGTTLFLDEIGEMPTELQARLLRVMDAGGEYQRLGEGTTRRADLRILAATNRSVDALKHDVVGRFPIVIGIPALAARREDLALLLEHRFRALAADDEELTRRFTDRGRPRFAADLIVALLRAPLPLNAREIDTWLWRALPSSTADTVVCPPISATDSPQEPTAPPMAKPARQDEPTAEEILAALDAAGGVVAHAWAALGLSSRYALYRRMKRLGLSPDEQRES